MSGYVFAKNSLEYRLLKQGYSPADPQWFPDWEENVHGNN